MLQIPGLIEIKHVHDQFVWEVDVRSQMGAGIVMVDVAFQRNLP